MTAVIPYEALERIFHEPNRLAITSALCASGSGMTFNELKETCRLTDGNLNRHLKVLEEGGIINIRKEFVGSKPRTTVMISARGLSRFNEYLSALAEVLEKARAVLPGAKKRAVPALAGKHATA